MRLRIRYEDEYGIFHWLGWNAKEVMETCAASSMADTQTSKDYAATCASILMDSSHAGGQDNGSCTLRCKHLCKE